jgi:putative transposase
VKKENEQFKKTGENVGIDLNVKNVAFSTNLNRSYLKVIQKLEKYDKKYFKIQKKLSQRYHKKSRSKNTKKLQKKQNKIHKKVKNIKEDFFHQTSLKMIKDFDRITIEKLDIKKMIEGDIRHLRKSISEVSWDSLVSKIKYKAEMHNKILIQINPAYTSQRCHNCGHIDRKNRKIQSVFHCISCNHKENADINAARNILDYDTWSLEQKTRWDARHPTKSLA